MIRIPHIARISEEDRYLIEFSGPEVRLDPRTETIRLSTPFSTTGIHWALCPLFYPERVARWIGFESDHRPTVVNDVKKTDVKFTIHDDEADADYYWDGSTWAVSDLSDSQWCSETDIANNFVTLYSTRGVKQLRLRVRLITSDSDYTPIWRGAIYDLEVDVTSIHEDLFIRGLVRQLKANVRSVVTIHHRSTGGNSFSIAEDLEEAKGDHVVSSIVSIYNHTDDPEHRTNLLSSFNPSTNTVTLTSSVTNGKVLAIIAKAIPEVIFVGTDNQYTEIEKVPSIIIHDVRAVSDYNISWGEEYVLNRGAGTATVWDRFRQTDFQFTIALAAVSVLDIQSLVEEVKDFGSRDRMLVGPGTGIRGRFGISMGSSDNTTPGDTGLASATIPGYLRGVVFPTRKVMDSAEDGVYPVLTVHAWGAQTKDPVI